MIQMTLKFAVPFDEEVETLADVCDEITEGTGVTYELGIGNIVDFMGNREQIMTFLGQYEADAYADDQL